MRNAMWVGGGITGMGEIPILGVKEKGIAKIIRDIFRNGEQGFFYDPSDIGTVYQDAAGTTAVTPIGQPVGLMLDKGRGLALGPNKALVTSINGVQIGGTDLTNYLVANSLVKGRLYKVQFTITGYSGTGNLGLSGASSDAFYMASPEIRLKTGNTVVDFFAVAGSMVQNMATRGTNTANFENIQISEVLGNHAYQTTSAARPILKQAPILGVNVLPNFDFTTWSKIGSTSTTAKAITVLESAGGVRLENLFEIGKTYKITAKLATTATTALLVNAANGATPLIATATGGTVDITYTATSSTLYLRTGTGTTTVDELVIKEVKGYRTNQNYINYDGVDDKLITGLPAPITNATVLRAVPGVGTVVKYSQMLPMMYEDATNHAGLVAIDRVLTRQEQISLMTELDKKAGATSLDTLAFKAFDNNQVGFVYDPNDLSTMFQDANGLKRVTQLGEPVGLILDKSKPNGRELAVNGSFKYGTNRWSLSGTANLTPQGVRITGFGPDGVLSQSVTCEVGKTYLLTAKVSIAKGGIANSTGTASQFFGTRVMTATSTSHSLHFRNYGSTLEADFTITDISFREISSNNAYQTTSASRPILRQNDITGANYLEFDGADDSLETGIIDFTPTDKVSLFAGVRKLSDAYSALCIELGNGTSSNSKAFALFAPSANGMAKYDLRNSVTAVGASTQDTKFNAPNSAVLTGLVTPNEVNKVSLSVNGEAALTSDRGNVGNLIAAPLYIGRRGGTSLPFTGHIYGLIGIGKLVSDSETTAIEKELAKRVGVTLNV